MSVGSVTFDFSRTYDREDAKKWFFSVESEISPYSTYCVREGMTWYLLYEYPLIRQVILPDKTELMLIAEAEGRPFTDSTGDWTPVSYTHLDVYKRQPKTREVELGRAEVRAVYKISNVGTIAGAYVIEGKVARNALLRVVRDGIVLTEDKIASLKRFKDDAKEVAQGYECGIGLEKFNDIKEGDIFESFIIEEYRD